ncbi:hypothetical protein GCM10017711_18060 [Paeniglutamicibacter sulfureus]
MFSDMGSNTFRSFRVADGTLATRRRTECPRAGQSPARAAALRSSLAVVHGAAVPGPILVAPAYDAPADMAIVASMPAEAGRCESVGGLVAGLKP